MARLLKGGVCVFVSVPRSSESQESRRVMTPKEPGNTIQSMSTAGYMTFPEMGQRKEEFPEIFPSSCLLCGSVLSPAADYGPCVHAGRKACPFKFLPTGSPQLCPLQEFQCSSASRSVRWSPVDVQILFSKQH